MLAPIMILLIAFLAIALLVGGMYLHYKMQKETIVLAQEQAIETKLSIAKLNEVIGNLGSKFAYRQLADLQISEILSSSPYTTLSIREKRTVALEQLLVYILGATNATVEMEWRSDSASFFEESKVYIALKNAASGDDAFEECVLEFEVQHIPLETITAPGVEAYAYGNTLAVVAGLKVHVASKCVGTCTTDTIALCQKAYKESAVVTHDIAPRGDTSVSFQEYNPSTGYWGYNRFKPDDITPALLNVSYSSLKQFGLEKPVKIKQLLEVFPEAWTKKRENLVLSGPPSSGKTRLVRMLMQKAHEKGVSLYVVNGHSAQALLQNTAAVAKMAANTDKGSLIIIDNAETFPTGLTGALNELMDGIHSEAPLSVLLAANQEFTDMSTVRPGRVSLNVKLGALSEDNTKKLYEELKAAETTKVWAPLPDKAELLLGEIYSLGVEPSIASVFA